MRSLAGLAAILALAGCSSGGGGLDFAGPGGANYAAGSALGAALAGRDLAALAPAFEQAIENGKPGERFDWRRPAASGWVKAGERLVGDLKADPEERPPVEAGVALDETFETELGLYALTRNANVRTGPGTDYPTRGQLVSGSGVEVIGRVVGKPWMLAEVDGRVVGYIHESLMIRQPGAEFTLAGGPRKKAQACRAYEQRLVTPAGSDLFEGVACRDGGRWRIMPQPEGAPTKLF